MGPQKAVGDLSKCPSVSEGDWRVEGGIHVDLEYGRTEDRKRD